MHDSQKTKKPLSADTFWDYSVVLYSKPNVGALCLKAQDEWIADVNILLLCSWLMSREKSLSLDGWHDLLIISDDLQKNILKPLRQKRRSAKGSDTYDILKAEELQAEKEAQAQFIDITKDHIISSSKQNDPLAYYLKILNIKDAKFCQTLAEILKPA